MSKTIGKSSSAGQNINLGGALSESEQRYKAQNPRSAERQEQAEAIFPGGNTRSVLFYTPFPVTLIRAEGAKIYDLDGHEYTDFLGEFTAGLYGHSQPDIIAALHSALDNGIVLGGPNVHEAKLGELICKIFPSCQRVRFCNSGTEANIMALCTARIFRRANKILVFKGGYHGGVLMYGAGGSPINVPFDALVGKYNDIESAKALIEQNASDIAAILVEPMIGSGGGFPAKRDFLQGLRELATKHGTLLIFDEVMTSRLGPHGLQGRLGVTPDMTTFGKYLGGGLTFGGFGGRADVMDVFNSRKPSYITHAGTFNNNILTMAAGVAGLTKVYTTGLISELNDRGDRLRDRMNAIARELNIAATATGLGSVMNVHFHAGSVENPEDFASTPMEARALFHLEMMQRGFYIARRGLISLSIAVTDKDVDAFVDAYEDFLINFKSVLPSRSA